MLGSLQGSGVKALSRKMIIEGTNQEKDLPPKVDFDILGIISWPEFWDCNICEVL